MDSKSLNAFLQLSQTLHFGKASQLLHMSPSTLSRIICQLELDLGVSLFLRDNRTVEMTREGELVRQYAFDYFQEMEKLHQQLSSNEGDLQGSLSIYCSVTAAQSFLHEALQVFRRKYPGIEIVLHTGDTNAAVNRILDDQEDVAIAAKARRQPRSLDFKLLGQTPIVMIAPKGQLSWEIDSFEKHSWEKLPVILPERGVFREELDQWFMTLGFEPLIYAQVGGNEAIVSMVSLGYGVGFVPKIVVDNSPLIDQIDLLDNRPNILPIDVGFYAKKKRLKNPIIQALWQSV